MAWIKELFGLPTIGSTGILLAVGFLLRNWFITRITKSVQHEYNKDLEKHKDQLRKETDSELTKLRGGIEIEVEKAKLKFNLYSQKQFELYNDLWLKLYDLKISMNNLWQKASKENLWEFQDKLFNAYEILDQKAILIEQDHYEKLKELLNEFANYHMGKNTLIEIRRQKPDWVEDGHIERLIFHNMGIRDKLLESIEQMRNYLRNQISGSSLKIFTKETSGKEK